MAEPKKRLTSTRSGNRQSHDAIMGKKLSVCSHCKQSTVSHSVCKNCGFYDGKKIVNLKDEKTKSKKEAEDLKDE
jgi:large subunit ribosomal protein L32